MKKFFIVGCSRSGTTVLQQALNRHSQVVIPPETKFFYYFYGQSKACQLRHLKRINADLRISLPAPARRIRDPHEARAFYNQMGQRYLERLDREGVVYFGDKTPEHTGHLQRMREVFPDAKLIFVYRDGRDVALSLSKMPWISCDVYVGYIIWLYYYRVLRRSRQETSMDTYYVRYEDLVCNPAAELEKLLHFLGLSYEPHVAEGYGNHEGIPQREYPWKARALEKISIDRVGVWRRELSSKQVERLERLGRHALTDLGYELTCSRARRLSPWFLATLGWGLARCAARLPASCLRNELFGSALRRLFHRETDGRETPLAEVADSLMDEASLDALAGPVRSSIIGRTRRGVVKRES